MTDVLVRTLRLRGTRATRLARAAAVALPAALKQALADIDDVRIENISVRLDFDPDELDDATIATLWADAIRREVLAAGGSPSTARERARRADEAASRHPSRATWRGADAVAAARRWLERAAPRGPVPAEALRLAETSIAAEAIAAIGERGWANLVAELDRALHAPRSPHGVDHSAGEEATDRTVSGEQSPGSAMQDDGEPTDEASSIARQDHGRPEAEGAAEERAADRTAAARVATLSELIDPGASELDLSAVTRAAGLALVYPWLADLCREATSLHPGREEATVRALALATLIDPNDGALVADPLITILSGAPEPVDPGATPLDHADAVAQACERALVSFASLLPGFASSSPSYVREQWIVRTGVVDAHRDPLLLTAATHPLDVVLTRLPYPVALFALPWSPPIAVRFRP